MDLLLATGEFTHQANSLNTLAGGWIDQNQNWMADTFQVLFQSEICQGEEAAVALEAERMAQEEQAVQESGTPMISGAQGRTCRRTADLVALIWTGSAEAGQSKTQAGEARLGLYCKGPESAVMKGAYLISN